MNEDDKDSVPARPAGPRTFRLYGLIVLAVLIVILAVFFGTAPRETPKNTDAENAAAENVQP